MKYARAENNRACARVARAGLSDLPPEVIARILMEGSKEELRSLAMSCKAMNQAARHPSVVQHVVGDGPMPQYSLRNRTLIEKILHHWVNIGLPQDILDWFKSAEGGRIRSSRFSSLALIWKK